MVYHQCCHACCSCIYETSQTYSWSKRVVDYIVNDSNNNTLDGHKEMFIFRPKYNPNEQIAFTDGRPRYVSTYGIGLSRYIN